MPVNVRPAYVAMTSEMFEQLNLAQGTLGQNLFAKDVGNLFHSNALVGRIMNGGATNISIGLA